MRVFHLNSLKKIRVVVSLFFFFSISFLFLDLWNTIPYWINSFFLSLQLIPSLTKITVFTSLSSIGLVVVIGLTIAFGRVYCSTICPLGTYQDIIIHSKQKINRRKLYAYIKSPYKYHYSILLLLGILAVTGGMTLVNLLEPFSNYGRILTNNVEPTIILFNNALAGFLNKFHMYFLYNIPLIPVSAGITITPIIFILVVTYMSYKHGRLFCNSICPAGAILGLISRTTIFKIVIDKNSCNNCGACEKVCKANCIESETKRIDFPACIGCFNCIRSCPTDGIIYDRMPAQQKNSTDYNPGRRFFFKEAVLPSIALAMPTVSFSDSSSASGYETNKKQPVTPPGSISVKHFTNLCTACHLCVSACPPKVLYPSFIDYGIGGMFQPKMNYNASYCNYECTVCNQVCPTGAILPLDVETKKLVQIGKSVFVKDDCVVVAKKKDCAACSEHCPTKAVHMVSYEGNLKIPELNNDICIGCGACEHACPTTPRKAIYVTANRVHLQAKKPEIKKQENIFDTKLDFPF